MLLIQEIIAICVVDLKVADADFELVSGHLSHTLEDVGQSSRDDTTVSVSLSASRDCKCLSRSCLTVCKYGAIIAFETPINHIFGHFVKDCLLLGKHVKNARKLELVVIVFDLSMPQTVSLKIKLYFTLIRCQG